MNSKPVIISINNLIAFLLCVFLISNFSIAQKEDAYLKQQQKLNRFEKSKTYTPLSHPNSFNSPMGFEHYYDDEEATYSTTQQPLKSATPTSLIEQSRIERYGDGYGTGAQKKPNPTIKPVEPAELPDIDLSDVDFPNFDAPDVDFPSIGTWEFWRGLMIVILIVAALFGLFIFLKNNRPRDTDVNFHLKYSWYPTTVTISELEKKLAHAELSNDYRECVRIHFLFILKELIRIKAIDWKPEKTNHHYLKEVRSNKGLDNFSECIRIFELVWYGDYAIQEKEYIRLKPTLEAYYQSIQQIV